MYTWLASIRCTTCCNRYSSVSTNQKQERHGSSLIAAFKNMSPLLLLPDSVLSHFQSASWSQITLKMNENWAGNSTTPLENKGLCFIGSSRGACKHYVWCLKYCNWQKKTYWLSSRSQIFFYLDSLGQSSKWEGPAARIWKVQSYSINVQSPFAFLLVILNTRKGYQKAN